MLSFFKKLFDASMDDDKSDYDMIDLLAYECNLLNEALSHENLTSDEQNEILINYLKRADSQHEPINDFKEDLDWFNVLEPLNRDLLSGKVVILDFFTYCCINCMHILPDLKKIEDSYSVEDGLVVIGVHSAKFDNEKDSANILSAVQRYNITHPVVNDNHQSMWIDLKVVCWPTLIILGPRGNPLFVTMGEGNFETLEKYVATTMKFYKDQNAIKNHQLPLNPAADLLTPNSNLKFPGKIACSKSNANDETPELYAISDSGNHRVIIVSAAGEVLHKIGGKQPGFVDGDLLSAKFNSPQGVSFLSENILFVADTENHAVRRIDLKGKSVSTIAGIGVQGNDRVGGKIGTEQEISSPWDVAVYKTRDMDMSFHLDDESIAKKDIVLVAAAGTHQIWAVCIDDVIWWKFKKYSAGTVVVIAGNGAEENRNNSYPHNAAFAQPSGLSIGGADEMFIADSESSCIRKLSLVDGKVLAVAGGDRNPRNLFAFGDVDGKGVAAKLQHPLGVCFSSKENLVYVADTYNHKIKRIDVTSNHCETCNIVEESKDVMVFNEPGGLCLNPTGDFLYVANTNNHSIELVDLKTMISKPWKINFNTNSVPKPNVDEQIIKAAKDLKLKTRGGDISFTVSFHLSSGICFTTGAPQKWSIKPLNERWSIKNGNGSQFEPNQPLYLEFEVASGCLSDNIIVSFQLNLCAADVCFSKRFALQIPVTFDDEDGLDSVNKNFVINVSRDYVRLQ
ncbi:NHL repeat-containing protein 2 [Bradysia coprophila]|uniref:NHL repeat-containing protein 2 n=1 Tax=Bradysia coprophila TaxID=38358 RepID=UPI00187DA1C9|nr:NHL repeat-containing protein 2 [Bradysia coprophila]